MITSPIAIDHLLTHVESLDDAADLFHRMGFQLSPVSHIEAMGVVNRVVLMRPGVRDSANFIELMSVRDRSRLPASMAPVLSGPSRIGSMVLAAADIEALPRRIAAAGLHPAPITRVRREWAIPGEQSVFPEFDVMLPVEAPLRFNACRYENVELYRRSDWLAHPNGARRFSAVFAVAPDPQQLRFFESILGIPARELQGGGLCFCDGHVRFEILTAAEAAARVGIEHCTTPGPQYLGYEIEVDDLRALRARLDRERVPYRMAAERRICIDPETGLGNYIVFVQARQE